MDARLIIALPNGSMQGRIIEWFAKAGIDFPAPTRQHWVEINHPLILQVVWMRPQLVPEAIFRGLVDAGITGEDCHWEWSAANDYRMLNQVMRAGFGRNGNQPVRISLVASKDEVSGFPVQGEAVISEYPCWTRNLIAWPRVNIKPWHGSVEAFVPKLYRFGVTVVDTEESLRQNHLKIVKVLAISNIGLFTNPRVQFLESKSEIYQAVEKLGTLLKNAMEAV